MDLGLKDKVALITGAGSQVGFGKGMAMTLAREGCNIIACDKDIEGAEKTAADVKALGRKAIALKVDITKTAEVKEAVNMALKEFGKIDILINNAGVGTQPKPFVATTEEEWDTNININLRGTMIVTKAVLPHMIERKSGKIVSMSSTAGLSGMSTGGVYGAAKAGIVIFTSALAKEVNEFGINVNCMAPGLGATGFHKASNFPKEYVEKFIKEMAASGRTTTPEELGDVAAFLVSDVSKNITGQCIRVSGLM
jgi:NAD(P)-dependent dehydrogenase (short-subunit alcohol dehydrogenase family)